MTMKQKIYDTIARLNGNQVDGYTITDMVANYDYEDYVMFCIILDARFKMITRVSRRAIANDNFDLYGFMTKKIIAAVRMIGKRKLTEYQNEKGAETTEGRKSIAMD